MRSNHDAGTALSETKKRLRTVIAAATLSGSQPSTAIVEQLNQVCIKKAKGGEGSDGLWIVIERCCSLSPCLIFQGWLAGSTSACPRGCSTTSLSEAFPFVFPEVFALRRRWATVGPRHGTCLTPTEIFRHLCWLRGREGIGLSKRGWEGMRTPPGRF